MHSNICISPSKILAYYLHLHLTGVLQHSSWLQKYYSITWCLGVARNPVVKPGKASLEGWRMTALKCKCVNGCVLEHFLFLFWCVLGRRSDVGLSKALSKIPFGFENFRN